MPDEPKRTEKHPAARDSLPDELKHVFDDFVTDYKFYGMKHYGSPFISYIILEEVTTVAANTFTSVGLMTLGSIIGFYVAGATWEDIKRK